MVFQDPFASLNPLHTVRYHLERALRIHSARTGTGGDRGRALDELLEKVRLTPAEKFRDAFPHELSGGQRQRVAIARALAASPRVLLADEPVSMLDVSIRLEVLDLLEELRRDLDLAILYITHDIASARYFADEILVMYAGEIVERGPAEDAHPATGAPVHAAARRLGAGPRRVRRAACAGPSARRPPRGRASSQRAQGCRFAARCPLADRALRRADATAAAASRTLAGRGLLAARRLRAVTCLDAAQEGQPGQEELEMS